MTLGVWQATGAQDIIGKVFGVFFPVLAFVAIGTCALLPDSRTIYSKYSAII